MKKIINILEYIVAILIVLNCRSVYQQATYRNYRVEEMLLLVMGVLLFIKIGCRMYDKNRTEKAIVYLFMYYMYAILFFLLNDVSTKREYIYVFIVLFPELFLYYYTNKNQKCIIIEMLKKISNVIIVFAIMSLIIYIVGPVANIIKPNGSIYMNWGGVREVKSYYGLQFITQRINIFGIRFVRNTSIFTEGPMYSLVLTIALAIELFVVAKKEKYKQIILLITIITTISTTGIIISASMIIISMLISRQTSSIKQVVKMLLFPVIALILIIVMFKFFDERSQTESWSVRLDDYNACYAAWKQRKIIGLGFGNENNIKQYMSYFRVDNQGLSNSILVILAEGGIYLFTLYAIPFIKMLYYGNKYKNKHLITFTVIILILLITTIFHFTAMIINLLAMGYALTIKEEEKNNKII